MHLFQHSTSYSILLSIIGHAHTVQCCVYLFVYTIQLLAVDNCVYLPRSYAHVVVLFLFVYCVYRKRQNMCSNWV